MAVAVLVAAGAVGQGDEVGASEAARAYSSGFRVQIVATPSPLAGQRALRRAGRISELPASIDWEDGLYKVRIGAFLERASAERGRAALLDSIPDAWVVPGVVNRTEVAASMAALAELAIGSGEADEQGGGNEE
ncbi:MAG: hypothetical protein CME06_00340 [Gemmatimonadetes bacterium]|nr:hypothetical protein [Gemmatimonadota bacterium]